jgi:hypothetical protein
VVFHDLLADRQAQPGALGFVGEGIANLFELLEHQRLIRRFDAAASIDHPDHDFATAPFNLAGYAALNGEFHGVGDEVDDYLNQAVPVTFHHRQIGGEFLEQFHRFGREQRGRGGHGPLEKLLLQHQFQRG